MNTLEPLLDRRPVPLATWFAHPGDAPAVPSGPNLGDVLAVLGAPADPGATLRRVRQATVRRGRLLFSEGMAPESLHIVRSGWFKCTRTATDGYEHVLAFAGRGDVLGFEGLASDHLPFSAEALEDATVYSIALHDLDELRRASPALDHALQRALVALLLRAAEVADMMAAVASEVRLARFLVWLSQRMAERGESPRRFLLRMTRRDIASLLGMAHETISRGFGLLAERGQVRVDLREVEILDLDGLKASTVCTRRDVEPPAARTLARRALPNGITHPLDACPA